MDVVSILTDQSTPRSASTYWAVLKKRLNEEGAQLLTNCKQLKMTAADGKKRLRDIPVSGFISGCRQFKFEKNSRMNGIIVELIKLKNMLS